MPKRYRHSRGVSGDNGDCGVGITPQMCNRVTELVIMEIWVLFQTCPETRGTPRRDRYGVNGTEALKEVLLFLGKSEEKVDRWKKMLEKMWTN